MRLFEAVLLPFLKLLSIAPAPHLKPNLHPNSSSIPGSPFCMAR